MTDDGQPDLFTFDGETYDHEKDGVRLNAQLLRTLNVMRDGQWRTLAELEKATGDPQASVSARLRDLRKMRFGGSEVERRRRGEEKRGLHEYRLTLSKRAAAAAGDA